MLVFRALPICCVFLKNLMDGIICTMRINVKALTFPAKPSFLDLGHRSGSLTMGKRMEVAAELDISQRLVAYYECAVATPPAHLRRKMENRA